MAPGPLGADGGHTKCNNSRLLPTSNLDILAFVAQPVKGYESSSLADKNWCHCCCVWHFYVRPCPLFSPLRHCCWLHFPVVSPLRLCLFFSLLWLKNTGVFSYRRTSMSPWASPSFKSPLIDFSSIMKNEPHFQMAHLAQLLSQCYFIFNIFKKELGALD